MYQVKCLEFLADKSLFDIRLVVPVQTSEDDIDFDFPVRRDGEYSLMQFTGLHDKNGKEVFADDIMRVGEYMFRVYAVPGGFSIKPPFWSRDMGELNTGDELIMNPLGEPQNIAWIRGQCEVIGNIYENPELLSK